MQIPFRCWLGCLPTVGLLALTLGCGGEPIDPEYKPVSGMVTLDGQPLPDAQISFVPPETGSSGSGFTDENGKYELYYAARRAGAKLGENQVFITKNKPSTGKQGEFAGRSEADMEMLPARYNRKTELTATVEDKRNEIDFDLKSK
ncbi:carboxypeptidase-like regulatory domain-containing protein [Blastopirellula sp. J2-11]|uniref:carboxypeptidase-like regulatory domain-containing protein n=1 Tax=Blastopirellula sp. J2-11 TaxID=2943192 RepID=UPI0021C89C93|nr:carboxypeptidase-like regulatory domain-containing protein [Blastopirellula sp. J2-11]UUO08614.1 carboxypeptidase-like regulatory domain-containing protein [Blastopirellula sp. J2-11]